MLVQGTQQGLSIMGVDRSPAMLEVATRRLEKEGCNAPMFMGDGRALPLADGSFDAVIATFPAGYILEPSTLGEIWRVLRDGGRLIIVGLWVELNLERVNQLFPVFYGRPSKAALSGISQRAVDVGFRVRWVEEREGLFTVGGLIADREQ
jgi:SAM-dependent methyltransferase